MSQQVHEHEFEAARGLPERLPVNERLLWQGSPRWQRLAIEVLHVRKIGVYFALMLLYGVFAPLLASGSDAVVSFGQLSWQLPLALLGLALLLLGAWLISSTTVYTVTDRRVVMRVGVVLSVTFNLPYQRIDSVAIHSFADGCGDIVLSTDRSDRIAYLNLWPHVRPWRIARTEPMLRAVADAQQVATILCQALAAMSASPVVQPRAQPLVASQPPSHWHASAAVTSSSAG